MSRQAAAVKLSEQEQNILKQWWRAGTAEQRMVERARIILLAHQGWTTAPIAQEMQTRPARVSKWRQRFARHRLAGLQDRGRPGKPHRYDRTTQRRILSRLDQPPPQGQATWTGSFLAAALGDVSEAQVWRVLRSHGISLRRRRSWCSSTDPEFAAQAAAVIGLYGDPPENALVLSVEEKPSMQALERAPGWIRLPDGKALTGCSPCYTRHGTTTRFAARNVLTGEVKTGHYRRRRRREFLHFRNEMVAWHPGRPIQVVLDNRNTPKPKEDRWLRKHPHVPFHYTPTDSSWLNQIECWCSILSRKALRGARFTSPAQVRQAMDDFGAAPNQRAAPLEWKTTVVPPAAPKRDYANLRN